MIKKINILIIILLVLLFTGCDGITTLKKVFIHQYKDLLLLTSSETIGINEYTIYGTHFNLKGDLAKIKDNENNKLVLKSATREIEFDIILKDNYFTISEYINKGVFLENLPIDNYLILLKTINNNDVKYYNLVNETNYQELEYYTITKNFKNNRIVINYDNYKDYKYMYLEVKEEKLPENIYDIVIDPGHGGNDPGATNGKYKESILNLEYALMVKDALTDLGLKVKLTRETNETIKTYGHSSRTAITYETKAKLMLSLHLNSGTTYNGEGGVEIYIASGDETSFAKYIADSIVDNTSTVYSKNNYNRLFNGVYERVYSTYDIKDLQETAEENNWEPYDVDDSTTYYYFIRETGGIMTKAFADGRNPKYEANPYYNANYGAEAYLVELGYISNSKNLKILLNEKEKYVKAIKESVKYYIEDNK